MPILFLWARGFSDSGKKNIFKELRVKSANVCKIIISELMQWLHKSFARRGEARDANPTHYEKQLSQIS